MYHYVLYDGLINVVVSQKQNGRCEGEGTGTKHAVTEVEFTFLDISWCIYIKYRSVKNIFYLC
jgi:hypothetical protein